MVCVFGTIGASPRRMLNNAGLLTRQIPAGGTSYPEQAKRVKAETYHLRYVEERYDDAITMLAEFLNTLLVFRQPSSRRSIHNWNPSKESLRQINVVPDFTHHSRPSCRHRVPRDQGAVYAGGPFDHDRSSRK